MKATKTLQAKDRLIAQLKENAASVEGSSDETNGNTNNLKSIEIEELKGEREFLKEELNSKNVALELLRAEMMDLESQTSMEIESLRDQIRNLQEQHDESKQNKEYLEQDLKNLRQQLEYSQDELHKQKLNLSNRLQEREGEIERLRNQVIIAIFKIQKIFLIFFILKLTTKNLGSTTEKELENRLHLLTENLIQKQTLIEALQSEKHSIFLQLERSEVKF